MQPRKTKTSTNGGARHPGLGERPGGNTISPSRRHHRGREGAQFTNDDTRTVGMDRSLPVAILQQMAADQEEPCAGQNFNHLVEACDQQQTYNFKRTHPRFFKRR